VRFDKTSYKPGIYYYGINITYKCIEEGKTQSIINNNGTIEKNIYENSFTYLKGDTWKTLKPGESVTLKSTNYKYNIETKPDYMNQNIYDLIFLNTDSNQYYWVGSNERLVHINKRRASYRVGYIAYNEYEAAIFFESESEYDEEDWEYCGIRPAISLDPNITFGGNASTGWIIE